MTQKTPRRKLDRSFELFQSAARRIPGGSQTNSKRPGQFAPGGYPIYAERGEGGHIIDVDGNEYIDLVQALGPIILGYHYPATDNAIRKQLKRGILYGLLSPLEVTCADLICEVVPCAEMVRFFKGGGEATAAAARTVRGYTGRELILNIGYRGWPDVWSTSTADPGVPSGPADSLVTPAKYDPAKYDPAKYDIEALEQTFAEYRDKVAAFFLDIQTEHPPAGYLAAVKELCHHNGALLVFDEIVTGFRLAPGGAQEYYGVTPDLACFAKAMANGMPLACVAGRADVMQTMADRAISITYGGEALSLAAAVASINEIRDKNVVAHLWKLGARLQQGLNDVAEETGIPFRCGGIEPMTTMAFATDDHDDDTLWHYFLQAMAGRGVLLRRGGLNFLNFSHTIDDVDSVVAAAADVFSDLQQIWGTSRVSDTVQQSRQKAPKGLR